MQLHSWKRWRKTRELRSKRKICDNLAMCECYRATKQHQKGLLEAHVSGALKPVYLTYDNAQCGKAPIKQCCTDEDVGILITEFLLLLNYVEV
uniref:Uncharacterized protein n=1 Tax=Sphaerodactylus townsendi TaxID=933632 RepID=A0ACB8FBU3_9SAUR